MGRHVLETVDAGTFYKTQQQAENKLVPSRHDIDTPGLTRIERTMDSDQSSTIISST